MKQHTTQSGKHIQIWDGLIDYAPATAFFEYINNSLYRIGWGDGYAEEQRKYKYLYASLTLDECMQSGFFPAVINSKIFQYLKDLEFKHAMVNLSCASDVHYPHIHQEQLILLYYANPIWKPQWFGETLFYNESATEIELALPYTPHRFVLFDASIPHAIRPQSRDAETHRFTFAMVFDKPVVSL